MGLSIKDPVLPMLAADIGALCARASVPRSHDRLEKGSRH
jgi:hypothetical protein